MTKILLLVGYLLFITPMAIAGLKAPPDTGFPEPPGIYEQGDLFTDYLPTLTKKEPAPGPPFDTAAKVFNPQAVLP